MTKTRLLSAILAAVLMLGSFAACGAETPDSADTSADTTVAVADTTTAPAETTPGTTGRADVKDNLPADLRFDGETFNAVYRNEQYYAIWDVVGTDNSGEMIHDLVWERNRRTEERLGITLNLVPTQGTTLEPISTELKSLVLAGSDDYDAIVSTANSTVTRSLYPYLYELSELPHLDITEPWWKEASIMEMSLDGEHYRYLLGDNTLNPYFRCGVIFYNKAIYEDVHGDPDDMYKTVLDGTWTYDKLMELSDAAYKDDGDGVQNASDRFGLMLPAGYTETTIHMIYSCDIETYRRTEAGGIDLSVFQNEKTSSVLDKLIAVCHAPSGVYVSDKNIDSCAYFAEGRSLFWSGRLSNVTSGAMREMQADYGILPMPKYDEAQEKYVSLIHDATMITCVPKSVKTERSALVGATLEAWAAEGYRTVITAFLDTALKTRYSRDELSGQVIDVILDAPVLSFVTMYAEQMANILNNAVLNPIKNGNNTYTSSLKKLLPAAQKQIDNYLTQISETDQ